VKALETVSDGRRARAVNSRKRIVAAVLALVREGHVMPSADVVAERAAVGRRTVFRLFKDMDSVYAEMHSDILARVEPLRAIPIEGATPAERLQRLIDRRVRLFEEIMAVKIAADLHRQRSAFLKQSHMFMVQQLREILAGTMPPETPPGCELFEALDAALSFDVWRRLRHDQGLSVAQSEAILRRTAGALLG